MCSVCPGTRGVIRLCPPNPCKWGYALICYFISLMSHSCQICAVKWWTYLWSRLGITINCVRTHAHAHTMSYRTAMRAHVDTHTRTRTHTHIHKATCVQMCLSIASDKSIRKGYFFCLYSTYYCTLTPGCAAELGQQSLSSCYWILFLSLARKIAILCL